MDVLRNNENLVTREQAGSYELSKTFMANVFSWMFAGLAITAIFSYYFSTRIEFVLSLLNPETGGLSLLGWVVTLAPLGFALAMTLGYHKFSAPIITLLFVAYAFLMGMSLSTIFLVYTASSIFKTFMCTAATFGVMAVLGYTTKTDLTKFGSIMIMGLIGIIIASLVNLFMKSDTLDYIISIIGVLVFTGLTAYDVQKLKRIGMGVELGTGDTKKLQILGAFTLYLDFVNLFLFLLRFFGNSRD